MPCFGYQPFGLRLAPGHIFSELRILLQLFQWQRIGGMGTNITAGHTPPLGRNFDHLLPVGGQRHRFPHPWIMEWGLAEVHDKRIPPGTWSHRDDRIGESLVQDLGLGPFKMAGDPRHGQLPRAEGGEDLREIRHHHGLIPIEVREARLPVVRIALGTKIHAWCIRLEFEWPRTNQEFGVFPVHPFGDARLHHHCMGTRQQGHDRCRGPLKMQDQGPVV